MTTYQGTFRKLIVWQTAKALAKNIYCLANKFPAEEKYGLSAQIKRAAISVMSNIAEGNQRAGKQDALNFFNIAFSSLTETDCQADLAYELGYIQKRDYDLLLELLNKTAYLLFRLIDSKKNPNSRHSLNSPKSPKKGGFSLIELIVVVSIISIMSVSAVVGVRYMGGTMRVKQAAGYIGDVIKRAEMEALRGDYKKNTIHFTENYLVIVSEPEDKVTGLTFSGANIIQYGYDGILTKTDGEGRDIEVRTVVKDGSDTVNFTASSEIEWAYRLSFSGGRSEIIRFIHFSLEREKPENTVQLSNGSSPQLVIEAPYAKKYLSDGSASFTLEVSDLDGSYTEELKIL
ncbi:four helix bundle protein [Candidatus Peregrinibacteria bacterium]|nr:four helix bundle protein [Candidatus Peregrinibacteria bacterium]